MRGNDLGGDCCFAMQRINNLDHLAQSLAMRGQDERAIWCWRQVQKLQHDIYGVALSMARAHWRLAQLHRAHTLYLQHLRIEPGDAEALDAAALREFAAGSLAPYKCPRLLHRVAALPRNVLGNVQKHRLQGGAVVE